MPNKNSNKVSVDDSDPRVRLAGERTLLAYERTQIAWIRTALTLISFGFAISEFFTYLRQQQGERATVLSPRAVGLTMVVIALIGLTLATCHHQRAVKLLRRRWPDLPAARGYVMAGMIAFLGVLVLIADLIR
jgi:inner membrane protein YidH